MGSIPASSDTMESEGRTKKKSKKIRRLKRTLQSSLWWILPIFSKRVFTPLQGTKLKLCMRWKKRCIRRKGFVLCCPWLTGSKGSKLCVLGETVEPNSVYSERQWSQTLCTRRDSGAKLCVLGETVEPNSVYSERQWSQTLSVFGEQGNQTLDVFATVPVP